MTWNTSTSPTQSRLDATLTDGTEAIVVRSVGVGQTPDGVYTNSLADGLGFATSALLANGATYDSTVLSLVGYTQVQTSILSDVNGTIVIDFVRDSGGADILRTLTIPYLSADGYQLFGAPAFTPFVRYRFTADEAGQADFYFDTKFTTKALSGQVLGTEAFVSPTMVANLNRSVLVAKNEGGTFINAGAVTKDDRTAIFTVSGYSNTFSVHLDVTLTPNGTDVAYMLVDLSNTAVWPHTLTGEVVIEYLIIEIDPHANFTGDFKIGYLKNVDGTNGDFDTVIDIDMATKSDVFQETIDFGSHALHCSDTSHLGPVDADNALFQTDVNLGGPDDPGTLTYPSGDGDLVLLVSGNNNPVGVSVTLGYETAL